MAATWLNAPYPHLGWCRMLRGMASPLLEANDVLLGREAVERGLLRQLRIQLGLPQAVMADLLGVDPARYRLWEQSPATRLWTKSAIKVGRFYRSATSQLRILEQQGVPVADLMPFMAVAPRLGMTHEGLMREYRDGYVKAVDLGVLGLWMRKEDFEEI